MICYDKAFPDRWARSLRLRYERRGLPRAARRVVDVIVSRGVAGATTSANWLCSVINSV